MMWTEIQDGWKKNIRIIWHFNLEPSKCFLGGLVRPEEKAYKRWGVWCENVNRKKLNDVDKVRDNDKATELSIKKK